MRRSLAATLDGLVGGRLDRATRWVVAIALAGLVARLIALGSRISHFDEGRVAWWTMRYAETGSFEYRFIIHGPFVQHVNTRLFPLLGVDDFVMRLIVALVGAALPLSVLLFRDHLRDDELAGAAAFLAFNPVLLYYSRFFRSTILVAAFAFVAFGFLVRAYDRRSLRGIHVAAVFLALAFAAKENAAVYVLVWLGGSALLVDHALFRTGTDEAGADWLSGRLPDEQRRAAYRESLPRYLGHAALAVALFLGISLFFYAPRSPNSAAVGFWEGVTNPALAPDLLSRTVEDVRTGYGYWFGGSVDEDGSLYETYVDFLSRTIDTLRRYALPLFALSIFGFLAERYTRPRPRNLVLFTGYWGFVSVLGYPLGTDIYGAWITVNMLVPLAIPAGVGLATVVRWTREAFGDEPVWFAANVVVLLTLFGLLVQAAIVGVYLNPTGDDNELVQYAQPADDFRPAMAALADRATDDGNPDVLFVGEQYVQERPRSSGIEPHCTNIVNTLPVQWYLTVYDASGDCVRDVSAAPDSIEETDPVVVIAPASRQDALAPHLRGYDAEVHGLRTFGSEAVFFTASENATG